MNAATIIEEINRLPNEEKNKVIDYLSRLPNAETLAAMEEPTEGLPRFKSVEDLFAELND